jgi:hypothetical protein
MPKNGENTLYRSELWNVITVGDSYCTKVINPYLMVTLSALVTQKK